MKLEHFGMAEPGDCRLVFTASAEELAAALAKEQAAPDAPQDEEELLTAAVNRTILEGFDPLYRQLVQEQQLVPVTDPDFELLAVNRAEGFRAGAQFYTLPPLELELRVGLVPYDASFSRELLESRYRELYSCLSHNAEAFMTV